MQGDMVKGSFPYPEQRDGADHALVLRRGKRGVGGLEDLCRFGVG